MNQVEVRESIKQRGAYDVIVSGGGVAGAAAAVAARRAGAEKVLLLEKTNLLGGLATIGLINLFVPMCNGRGKQIIFGMAEEFLRLSIRYGYDSIPSDWRDGEPSQPTEQRYITRYSPQIFALALTELLQEEGVEILFDAVVSAPVMTGKHCDGIIVESKSGREFCAAGVVIDATGDGDLLYRAGMPTTQGNNYFSYVAHSISLETCAKAIEYGDIGLAIGWGARGGRADLYGRNHPEGMPLFTGTSVDDVSNFLIRNQRLLLDNLKGQDRKQRDVATLPTMPQFRTTRHLNGDYIMTTQDVYKHFEDSIGAIGDFDHRDFLYEIPYRTLFNSEYDNFLTAGRSASAEGYAWDILRVIPPAIITGQAAGTAAAMAVKNGVPVAKVDIAELQRQLEAGKVMIHFDDALIPGPNDPGYGESADFGHI